MTTRRKFIQAAAISALPAPTFPPGARAANPRPVPDAVVFDAAHAATRAFGARWTALGTRTLSVTGGDVTALWLEVRVAWVRRRIAVAGLTEPAILFCLENLAWSHGLRVVFHAEHIAMPDGTLQHHVQRDAQMARLTTSHLQRAGALWPTRLADAMAARSTAPAGRRPGPSLAALQPALPEGAQLLTSWIIAAA